MQLVARERRGVEDDRVPKLNAFDQQCTLGAVSSALGLTYELSEPRNAKVP
jgi:hypothetical protein